MFTKYPLFGSRQIVAYLPRNGFETGRHRVRRLIGIMSLQAIENGPNTRRPATHALRVGEGAGSTPSIAYIHTC